ETLKYAKKAKDNEIIAATLYNMGNIYIKLNDSKKAMKHMEEAAKIYQQLGNREQVMKCAEKMKRLKLGVWLPDLP
nr:tetratricopeptide repeat protein [Candidatus Freyarchaeota archaeon]